MVGDRARVTIHLTGLLVVAMSAALAAQTTPQTPVFRSGVDLIEIDVTVVDGDSFPVRDLQAADFAVTVDGESRPVVQAQFIPLRPPGGVVPTFSPPDEEVFSSSNTDQTPGRLVVIAVDEASILFGEGRHVMRAAGEFVDRLSAADRVGLAVIPHGVHIDFTSDHDRVRHALEGLSGLGERRRGDLLRIGIGEAYRIAEFSDRGTEVVVARRLCGDDAEDDVACLAGVRRTSRQIVQDTRRDSINARLGLESLLGAMRELEGPNTLVWISGGLVIDDQFSLLEIKKRAAASRTTLYVMMVDEPLIDMSRASFQETARDDRSKREEGLLALSALTGARLLRGHYNPGPLFERMERELSGYYLLGVQLSPTDRDQQRRAIKVSVDREGVRVRARREISFAPEDAHQSVDEQLARMLRSPIAIQELPVRVATYAHPDSQSEQIRLLVAAEIAGGASSPLTVGVVLRDTEGTAVWTRQQQVVVEPTQTSNGPVLEISFPLRVEPGRYALRLAVADAAGQRGSVEHPIRAQARTTGPLSVGDLVVADPSSVGSGTVLAAVDARVTAGRLVVYTELHADSAAVWDRTAVHIGVADSATGPARAQTTVTFDGSDDALHRVLLADIAVAGLPPGRYVARARVVYDSGEVALLYRPFRIAESPQPRRASMPPGPPVVMVTNATAAPELFGAGKSIGRRAGRSR